MTKFRGSICSNQTAGIAVLRGLFLGEQAVAVCTTVALDPVAGDKAQPVNGQGQAVVRDAALVDQPSVSDAPRRRQPQSAQNAVGDCLALAGLAAFLAVMG